MSFMSELALIFSFNKIFIIFGLYLPAEQKCLKRQKLIVGIVLFLVIFQSLCLINGKYILIVNNVNIIENILDCVKAFNDTFGSCLIILLRYWKSRQIKGIFKRIVFNWNYNIQTNNYSTKINNGMIDIIKNHISFIFYITISFIPTIGNLCIYLFFFYHKTTLIYFIIQHFISVILFMEYAMISILLKILKNLILKLKIDLLEYIKNYYKLATPDIKKVENGDIIIMGWVKSASELKSDEQILDLLKLIAIKLCNILEIIESFNKTFGMSVCILCCSILSCSFVIIENVYFNIEQYLMYHVLQLIILLVKYQYCFNCYCSNLFKTM